MEQGQDEFFFALPYDKMDVVLFGLNHGMPAARVAGETGLTVRPGRAGVSRYPDQTAGLRYPLHMKPVLMEPVPEIGS